MASSSWDNTFSSFPRHVIALFTRLPTGLRKKHFFYGEIGRTARTGGPDKNAHYLDP